MAKLANDGSSGLPATEVNRTGPRPDGLERLFTLSPALLCIAGTDGYFKRVNPAFRDALGHTEAELLSRPFIEFVHRDDRPATLNELGKLSTGAAALNFENRYRHADGSYRWLLWNATPVEEEGVLYATAIDITEGKAASQMLRDLLHAAPDAMIVTDSQGEILKINEATERLFGYSVDELEGRSVELLVPARFRERHRNDRNAYAKDPRPRLMGEGLDISGIHKDGREFPVEISLGPSRSPSGDIVICAVRDRSQRKQRERELQKSQRDLVEHQGKLQALNARLVLVEEEERRRVARGLHDDVGQALLAASLSLSEMLEEDTPADRESSARELQRLLSQAIQTTRTLTFDLAAEALYAVGLGAALQSACELAEEQSGIRFQPPAGLEGNLIPETTKVILYRVGRELIRNVVKHSEARTAKLSLSLSGKLIRMTLEDDGRGFDAEHVQSQDDRVSFGLFSVDQQVAAIGGRIEIASSPGAGTRAVVIAPLDGAREGR